MTHCHLLFLFFGVCMQRMAGAQDCVPQQQEEVSARPGGSVSLKCSWSVGCISPHWLKLEDGRRLQRIASFPGTTTELKKHEGFDSNRLSGYRVGEDSHLNISDLQPSDSGVYFCSLEKYKTIFFGNGTKLQVKDETQAVEDQISSPEGVQTFVLVVGAVSMCFLTVIVILIYTRNRHSPGDSERCECATNKSNSCQDVDKEKGKNAALTFARTKNRRQNADVEAQVLYNSFM